MKTSERITTVKLLCFRRRLTFATTQPSRHESSSTNTDTRKMSSRPPTTFATVAPSTIHQTTTAGTVTQAEYMRPMR